MLPYLKIPFMKEQDFFFSHNGHQIYGKTRTWKIFCLKKYSMCQAFFFFWPIFHFPLNFSFITRGNFTISLLFLLSTYLLIIPNLECSVWYIVTGCCENNDMSAEDDFSIEWLARGDSVFKHQTPFKRKNNMREQHIQY